MDEGERWQEHLDNRRYVRFHTDIYMPDHVREAALGFLPPPGTELRLSRHYREVREERHLPERVVMPSAFRVIDVTIVKDTWAVFRVLVRFRWTTRRRPERRPIDLLVVLEGDYELVTAYWVSAKNHRPDLDWSKYEQAPATEGEAEVLATLPTNEGEPST